MGNATFIDGQNIRETKGTKTVKATLYASNLVLGEPVLIYKNESGGLTALSYTVTSATVGNAVVGILTDATCASSAEGTFAIKGKAPLISWATANSGILITAMDVVGTVVDSAAVSTATMRGFALGITTGASSIILW